MASVSTYLNFERSTEDAFNFYKSVFGTEFSSGIFRHGDVPGAELPEEDRQLVMNVALPILGGHILMGTDIPKSMGMELNRGNAMQISLHPDTRAEADALYAALSDGGEPGTPMQEMFWGDYYGDLTDKFGIRWLVDVVEQSSQT